MFIKDGYFHSAAMILRSNERGRLALPRFFAKAEYYDIKVLQWNSRGKITLLKRITLIFRNDLCTPNECIY